ncbi:MAG: DNA recombination protein RmuC, partial [Ruminococcus bromii]|nr:DNA recombination protein RmuC [Ruminococcus bromii]
MQEVIIIAASVLSLIVSIAVLIIVLKKNNNQEEKITTDEIVGAVRNELTTQQSILRQELSNQTQTSIKTMGDMLVENQRSFSQHQSEKMSQLEERMKTFSLENEQKLENIRQSMEKRLQYLQNDNNRQLEEMRKTVDEKLQKTLEEKMNKSFSLVNERLEQVYKGLGEMQNLAVGVGDLKKVLSNVKTRGILGEIQLG